MAMICVSGARECTGCMACYDRELREEFHRELHSREVLALSAAARRPVTYGRSGCRFSAENGSPRRLVAWQEE